MANGQTQINRTESRSRQTHMWSTDFNKGTKSIK